jgi:hypothetical protein
MSIYIYRRLKLMIADICGAVGIRIQAKSTTTNNKPYIDPDSWGGVFSTSTTTTSHSRCSSNAARTAYSKLTRTRSKTKPFSPARDV